MSNGKIQIISAIIALIGSLGAAYIGLIGNENKSEVIQDIPKILGNQIPDIDGYWRDSIYPGNTSKITQNGNRYSFNAKGFINEVRFTSSGNGTITGNSITSKYRTRYSNGGTSTSGSCSGTVSADAMRIEMSCRDRYLGTYPLTSIRD